jgi:hypothetical protein
MNELAVSIGVISFPGLLACIICDKVASHSPKWRIFKYSIYSFVFGVCCYGTEQAIYSAWQFLSGLACSPISARPLLRVWSIATAQKADISLSEVIWATALSPVIAIAATLINNYKVLNKLAQRTKISYKFGDENLFSYYLNARTLNWVYIRDPNTNQTYKGNVVSWSETDHIQEVVLSDVTVYEYETSRELYDLPTIYLAKPTGTFVIEAIPPTSDGK